MNNNREPDDVLNNLRSFLKGKRYLVIGGTGSIGRLIVDELLRADPGVVRVLSRDETKQLQMKEQLASGHPAFQSEKIELKKNIRFLIGDVRERERLERAMRDIDVVIQAAAMKHVDASEYNPFEAVRTNVIGTENVINAALQVGVDHLIGISTDKAINPPYVMGATKLLSEKLLTAANRWTETTAVGCVRFGNVLGTRGSVVPVVLRQIKRGGPVKMTDPDMRRFYVTRHQAAMLVLESLRRISGGEIYFLDMPVVRTGDLIRVLVDEFAPVFGKDPEAINIETVGHRPGEKKFERIITEEERRRAGVVAPLPMSPAGDGDTELDVLSEPALGKVVPLHQWEEVQSDASSDPGEISETVVDSEQAEPLSKEEVRALVQQAVTDPEDV